MAGSGESRYKRIEDRIDKLYLMLIGNGKPDESICYRVKRIEDNLGVIGKEITEIKNSLNNRNKSNKSFFLDKLIPSDVRNTVFLWFVRLGILWLVGDAIYNKIM